MIYFKILTNILLTIGLAWYLITSLQWYNYKISRVLTKHHKQHWHIIYFLIPLLCFYILPDLYFDIYFYFIFLPFLVFWHKKLDKRLVLTKRVQRFFVLLVLFSLFINALFLIFDFYSGAIVIVCLLLAHFASNIYEQVIMISFRKKAKKKLKSLKDLKIIAITASFGKTSIKNYLYQVLNEQFITYKTPRSVNTLAGLVLDVNNDLPKNTQIYIAEAGARQRGDIKKIADFLEPHYCIIGSIGKAHIEYFKTIKNILATKSELLKSSRMIKAFVHISTEIKEKNNISIFAKDLKVTKNNLDGIAFEFSINSKIEKFKAPVLGSFNATNLSVVILTALELGMNLSDIKAKLSKLYSVEHRLQKIEANSKLILDDSFNGNLDGMLEAIEIASTYEGRKVIITPGLVESDVESNTILAKNISQVFDFVILSSSLNIAILSANIDKEKTYILKDKSSMQEVLAKYTKPKDLILFANDAPNFI